jgi:hypothetical protein
MTLVTVYFPPFAPKDGAKGWGTHIVLSPSKQQIPRPLRGFVMTNQI